MPRIAMPFLIVLALLVVPAGPVPAQGPSLPQGLEEKPKSEQGQPGEPGLPSGLDAGKQEREKPAEPGLPAGLGGGESQQVGEPGLPSGLDGGEPKQSGDPGLPPGLGEEPAREKPEKPGEPAKKAEKEFEWRLPAGLGGFWEARGGGRTQDDPVQDRGTLAETRLQLSYDKSIPDLIPRGQFKVTTDFLYDGLDDDPADVDLEEGDGFVDLRETWLSFTPVSFMDVKAGRQILTWGTGNLIFLNDLFPKDYQSFFLGRHLDYLKAPSDALKTSFYSDVVNLDVVYTPRFDADRFVDGSRVSFFDPALNDFRGEDDPLDPQRPDDWFEDDEIAARFYRNIHTYEVAAYAYHGFWKSPAGTDPDTRRRTFPELSAYGGSVRGPLGPGIANAEISWYRSEDDLDGDDPNVRNSELRFLAGYEQEALTDLTVGVQYYLEKMLDYDEYRESLPPGMAERDEARHWLTLDLTQELMAQNQLVLSLFTFYSVSGGDTYLRPKVTYDLTDHWKLQAGANIFLGDRDTFFGKFQNNTNLYGAVRYSF